MNAIVNVDKNWGIGNKGELLISIPADMKMFREETTGNAIVLGRKTMETFPGGKPLPNRDNIVLSRKSDLKIPGATVVHDISELMEVLKRYDSNRVYVVGGETIYEQLLPYCDTVHVTKVDRAYEADAHFPNLDQMPEWEITAAGEEQSYFDTTYRFVKYTRK
ncbi:dihydrofolate reductase [Lacrimispora saccharolytica]|uniref:dihydrofolate reductase n=1 Tax=Lacrimispora saccharolytica TaxID=84030 RepID=UPI00265CCE2A|nr:dihydrofolate reductase [Lacrimispora saccharolytica]MCF2655782.1 dihydrofolate reductase [Lacrimispora saccharolytica]